MLWGEREGEGRKRRERMYRKGNEGVRVTEGKKEERENAQKIVST